MKQNEKPSLTKARGDFKRSIDHKGVPLLDYDYIYTYMQTSFAAQTAFFVMHKYRRNIYTYQCWLVIV